MNRVVSHNLKLMENAMTLWGQILRDLFILFLKPKKVLNFKNLKIYSNVLISDKNARDHTT